MNSSGVLRLFQVDFLFLIYLNSNLTWLILLETKKKVSRRIYGDFVELQ